MITLRHTFKFALLASALVSAPAFANNTGSQLDDTGNIVFSVYPKGASEAAAGTLKLTPDGNIIAGALMGCTAGSSVIVAASGGLGCTAASAAVSGTCPSGKVMTGITDGKIVCGDISAFCPSGKVLTGILNGTPTCADACVPQTQKQNISCGTGYTGSIEQENDYTCSSLDSGSWGGWYTLSNTCVSNCTPTSQTREIACSGGQTGNITQQNDYTCPGGNWGGWVTTANNCAAATPTAIGGGSCSPFYCAVNQATGCGTDDPNNAAYSCGYSWTFWGTGQSSTFTGKVCSSGNAVWTSGVSFKCMP